jgi:hypothetical protein
MTATSENGQIHLNEPIADLRFILLPFKWDRVGKKYYSTLMTRGSGEMQCLILGGLRNEPGIRKCKGTVAEGDIPSVATFGISVRSPRSVSAMSRSGEQYEVPGLIICAVPLVATQVSMRFASSSYH